MTTDVSSPTFDFVAADAVRGQRLARMKLLATGLLVVMSCLYVAARMLEPRLPWFSFVAAMAEAAMVGALADWFAVVALFRHPLGLPVPHTNIIAHSKNSLAHGLAEFVVNNFITKELVGRQLHDLDLAGHAAAWLDDNRCLVAAKTVAFVPAVLDKLNDEDIKRFLHEQIVEHLRRIEVAPIAGKAMELMTSGGKHHAILEDILAALVKYLKEPATNAKLKRLVRDRLGFLLRNVDAYLFSVSENLIDAIADLLLDIRNNHEHEMRKKLDATMKTLVDDLKHSTKYRDRGEAFKRDLLSHHSFVGYVEAIWSEIKEYITTDAAREGSPITGALADGIHQLAVAIGSDAGLREKLNRWLRAAIEQFADEHKGRIGKMITDKVAQWDGASLARKLELQVGSDLQFIRINGTVIGGLAGVLIYTLTALLQK